MIATEVEGLITTETIYVHVYWYVEMLTPAYIPKRYSDTLVVRPGTGNKVAASNKLIYLLYLHHFTGSIDNNHCNTTVDVT